MTTPVSACGNTGVAGGNHESISDRRGLVLDRVVLLGRTFDEYARYFALDDKSLRDQRILDIASGVSSFTAEGTAHGLDINAFDPIYNLSPAEIHARAVPDLDQVFRAVPALPVYKWGFYRDPESMRQLRNRALQSFLADFPCGQGTRYHSGQLPGLPFVDGQFDLTLVSYFLFVYEDQLTYEFHRDSLREIMRVTRSELRIYPTVTFEGKRSSFLERALNDATLKDLQFEIVPTDFEFLVNSNNYLSITRR